MHIIYFLSDGIIVHLNFNAPFSESTLRRRNVKTQLLFYRRAKGALVWDQSGIRIGIFSFLNIWISIPAIQLPGAE